jgi:hypothetical protein
MTATTPETPTTSDTCHDCGADAPDGPDYAIGPDITPVRLCWDCSDERTYIRLYTDFENYR